jgi:hypothetical protein
MATALSPMGRGCELPNMDSLIRNAETEPTMQTAECAERYTDPMEHRWGQRVTLELPVRLEVGGRLLGRGLVRNLSVSGALIETSLELPVFTNLVVTFPATRETAGQSSGLAASVVRTAPGGFAIEWRDMACPLVVALLERRAGRPVAALCDDPVFAHRRTSC